jgi:hypothetical protein
MQLWMENGAELALLIDPIDGNAVVYSPNNAPEFLDRPEEIAGTGPVAGFVLAARLWPTATP